MRLMPLDKAGRLQVQQATIARKLNEGYSLEEYKGYKILTKDHQVGERVHFILEIFRPAAGQPYLYQYYRSEESRARDIKNAKGNADWKEQHKAEQKAKGQTSEHAGAAKTVKAELQKAFPGVKFSATSDSYANGDNVHVSYTDGPTEKEVEAIANKYQYGHFDGMNDLYVDSNTRSDIPQTKYMFVDRHMSPPTRQAIDQWIAANLTGDAIHANIGWRVFQKSSIPPGAKVLGLKSSGKDCGSWEDLWDLDIEQTNTEAAAPPQVSKGKIDLIDYSERAFAVIGDTKPIKDKLKELGGKFNAHLSCGAGWIFSKKRLQEVTDALTPSAA